MEGIEYAPLHEVNKTLPPNYRDGLQSEAEVMRTSFLSTFLSFEPGSGDFKQLSIARRQLYTYLELNYRLSQNDKVRLAEKLWSLALPEGGIALQPPSQQLPVQIRIRLLQTIATLLRFSLYDSEPRLRGFLVLPWRPLHDALLTAHLRSGPNFPESCRSVEGSLLRTLGDVCSQARHFFPDGADMELWTEVEPGLRDTRCQEVFQSGALLVLLLRSDTNISTTLLPRWLALWGSINHCPEWNHMWLILLCRARKHAPEVDWDAHMDTFFARARLLLATPLGRGRRPEYRGIPYQYQAMLGSSGMSVVSYVPKLAKMLVFYAGRGGEEAWEDDVIAVDPPLPRRRRITKGTRLLITFLHSLRTYYHPSNGGGWSSQLALLMAWLCCEIARRVGGQCCEGPKWNSNPVTNPPLTADDVGALVDVVSPLALEMLYGKHPTLVEMGERTLRILAGVSPRSIAQHSLPLLCRALDPVEAVNHTHQAPSALRALGRLVRPLMHPRPHLAPHLPLLLQWSLPGIDPNDFDKTVAALEFYDAVLCWVPITAGASSDSDSLPPVAPLGWLDSHAVTPDEDAEETEELMLASEALGRDEMLLSWALAFIDQLWLVIEHRGSPAKSGANSIDSMQTVAAMSGLGDSGGGGGVGNMVAAVGAQRDASLSFSMRMVARQLFAQMDAPAHARAARALLARCIESPLPEGAKDAASLVEACTLANPAASLALFVPALSDGIRVDAPEKLMLWKLRLLGGMARSAGSALLSYSTTILGVLRAGLGHKSARVRKVACKLLRLTLHGLCETYTLEARSLPPQRWAKVTSAAEWRRLGEPATQSDLQVSWHEPSVKELQFAAAIVQEFAIDPMQALLASGGASALSGDTARAVLKATYYTLRGCISVVDDEGDVRGTAPIATGGAIAAQYVKQGQASMEELGVLVNLRGKVMSMAHQCLQWFALEVGEGVDLKVFKLVMRISQAMLVRGAIAHAAPVLGIMLRICLGRFKNQVMEGAGRMQLKALGKNAGWEERQVILDRSDVAPRRLLVERSNLQHIRRQHAAAAAVATQITQLEAAGNIQPMAPYRELFNDFFQLSRHSYATVRAEAQAGFDRAVSFFGLFLDEALPGVLRSLNPIESAGPISHPKITGDLYIISQMSSMKRISCEWPLLRSFLEGLCFSASLLHSLPPEHHEKLAARLQILLVRYLSKWKALPLSTDADRENYSQLVSNLLQQLSGSNGAMSGGLVITSNNNSGEDGGAGAPAVHWRYQLMITWCIMHLVRPDMNGADSDGSPPLQVWKWYCAGLSCGDGTPLQRLCLGGLARLLGCHSAEQDRINGTGHGRPPSPELLALLTAPAFLQALFRALALNHRKGNQGEPSEQWSLGVKEVISDSLREGKAVFPRTRLGLVSSFLWVRNARLVESLARVCGTPLLEPLAAAISAELAAQAVVQEDRRKYQCAVAEVVAGCARAFAGGKEERPNAPIEAAEMWNVVTPLLAVALEDVSLESCVDWADAVRLAYDGCASSPELMEPLTSILEGNAIAVLSSSSRGARDDFAAQARWLQLLQPAIIELATASPASSARAVAIAEKMGPLLVAALGHPFKACRVEIARCLHLLTGYVGMAQEWIVCIVNAVKDVVSNGDDPEVINAIKELHVADMTVKENGIDAMVVEGSEAAGSSSVDIDADGSISVEVVNGGDEDGEAAAIKIRSLKMETVLLWLYQAVSVSDTPFYLPILVPLLPAAFECVRDTNLELSAIAKFSCLCIAQAVEVTQHVTHETNGQLTAAAGTLDPSLLPALVDTIVDLATRHDSWQVRYTAVSFAGVFQTSHLFALSPAEHNKLDAALLQLLIDKRREVQEQARTALTTRLALLDASAVRDLCARFVTAADTTADALAAASKKRRRAAARAASNSSQAPGTESTSKPGGTVEIGPEILSTQLQSVLVLSSVVLASPYDVPPWVPRALLALSRHAEGGLHIKETVTHTFKEFRRCHQDRWSEHISRFTTEELGALEDVSVVPHYYA